MKLERCDVLIHSKVLQIINLYPSQNGDLYFFNKIFSFVWLNEWNYIHFSKPGKNILVPHNFLQWLSLFLATFFFSKLFSEMDPVEYVGTPMWLR